jgi:pre-mRNA-processing factor 40
MLLDAKLRPDIGYREAMLQVTNDKRFLTIQIDRERERLFDDYVRERVKRERDAEGAAKRKQISEYREFLDTLSEINISTEWRAFYAQYQKDPLLAGMEKIDVLNGFIDLMRKIEDKDQDQVRAERTARGRTSRKAREHFRKLLDEHWVAKRINVKTKWKEFRPLIKNDPRYVAMLDENIEGSTPAELFYDLIEDLEDRYQRDRKKLKDFMKEINLSVDSMMTYLVFEDRVKKVDGIDMIDPVNLKLLYHELRDRANEDEHKIKKKARSRFDDVLDRLHVRKTSTWESVQRRIPKTADVQYLPLSDDERLQIFNEHMKRRAVDNDFDEDSDIEEEGAVRERRAKKHRRRSHSSSRSREESGSDDGRSKKRSRERDDDRHRDEEERDRKRPRRDQKREHK